MLNIADSSALYEYVHVAPRRRLSELCILSLGLLSYFGVELARSTVELVVALQTATVVEHRTQRRATAMVDTKVFSAAAKPNDTTASMEAGFRGTFRDPKFAEQPMSQTQLNQRFAESDASLQNVRGF